MPIDENLRAALSVAEILDRIGIRWLVGGSLASAVHGIPRATLDADFVADLHAVHVKPLLQALVSSRP